MDPTEIFGPPISTYTADQAVDDGILVRIPGNPNHLVTIAVHRAIEAVNDGRTYAQKVVPLLGDAIDIANKGPRGETLWCKGLEGNVTGKTLWIGRNDIGGLTIMFPDDY